jgi:hypothetical protein
VTTRDIRRSDFDPAGGIRRALSMYRARRDSP